LSDNAFDLAIVWEECPMARALAKGGIPQRLGPSAPDTIKSLTHPIDIRQPPGPAEHRVLDYLRFVKKLGARPFQSSYFRPPKRPAAAVPATVALVPGSDFGPAAEWPLARFHEVARKLSAGHQLAVLPSPGQRGPATALARQLDLPVTELEGEALLDFLASCQALVGNDGSLPHLASLVGTPSVVIFGPNQVDWHRPLGKIHRAVHEHVACTGCLLNKCPLDHRCMEELEVEKVLAAFRELPEPKA
jgi:ADP-heptose:LPS heptosyltransferase